MTDYDSWRPQPKHPGDTPAAPSKQALLAEIIGNLQATSANALSLIRRAIALLAQKGDALPPSPAHTALELAIWSDKAQIPQDEVQRLAPLWIKYLGPTANGADAAPSNDSAGP